MNYAHRSRSMVVLLSVVLAILCGAGLFVIIDVVSGGLLFGVVVTSLFLVLLGSVNYWLWGRAMTGIVHEEVSAAADRLAPADEFVLEINDRERQELMRLLGHSLTHPNGTAADGDKAVIDKNLLEKLRMFGA